jgi:hypothetical protein
MNGPIWEFSTLEKFERAREICKQRLSSKQWSANPGTFRIKFSSVEAEETYAKAAAGLSSSATRSTEGQSQWS